MTEATRIHQEIMNLPCNADSCGPMYRLGHRDARHAAAEIAQHAIAELERENAELRLATAPEILAITIDWPATNARRGELIRRKVARTITDAEREELNRLQMFATARQYLFAPLPLEQLEKVRDEAQLDAIRAALGMPDATVPEMVERIRELRRDSLGEVLNS